jgi:hypothetical protein
MMFGRGNNVVVDTGQQFEEKCGNSTPSMQLAI